MNEQLKRDLDLVFKNYEVIQLHSGDLRERAESADVINVNAFGQSFSFTLERKHLRSEKLKLTDAGESLEREEGVTFHGKLSGKPGTDVRLTADGSMVNGYIFDGENRYFLTSARLYTASASDDDVVVYLPEDLIRDPLKMQEAIRVPGLKRVQQFSKTGGANQLRTIEVATDADYSLVSRFGSPEATNNYIMSVVNIVDGLYEKELGLSLTVVHQNTWSSPDPYNGNDLSSLLMAFQNYWEQNKPVNRDISHLFTAKVFGAGLAYVGTVCQAPEYAYGVSGFCGDSYTQSLVMAHEMGHNLGAEHADTGECVNSVMNAILSQSVTSFCQPSRNTITSYVSQFGQCLSTETSAPQPVPEPIPAPPPVVTPEPIPPIVTPEPIPVPPVAIPEPSPEPVPPVATPEPPPVAMPEPVPPVVEPAPTPEPEPSPTPPVVTPPVVVPEPPVVEPQPEPVPSMPEPVPPVIINPVPKGKDKGKKKGIWHLILKFLGLR